MPNSDSIRAALRDLALGASVEVLARPLPPAEVLAGHLRHGTAVYVPFPPKGRWRDTIVRLPGGAGRGNDARAASVGALGAEPGRARRPAVGAGRDRSRFLDAGGRRRHRPRRPVPRYAGPARLRVARRSRPPAGRRHRVSGGAPPRPSGRSGRSAPAQDGVRPDNGYGALAGDAVRVLAGPRSRLASRGPGRRVARYRSASACRGRSRCAL